jgi:hypothetical protein
MLMKAFSIRDFENAKINNQRVLTRSSTDISDNEDNVSFFVMALNGTGAVIKDKNANTVIAFPGIFNTPIRVDNGITLSASGAASVHYFTLRNDVQ